MTPLEIVLLVLIFLLGGAMTLFKFISLSKSDRYSQIQGWLLQAVLLAEKEFGSGTGKLKLSFVYDKFCERFPWLAKVVKFETFSGYVDDALEEMRKNLEQNNALQNFVEQSSQAIQKVEVVTTSEVVANEGQKEGE